MVRCAHVESAEPYSANRPAASMFHGATPRVLVLTGPTAVGKTQLSLALAEQLDGEVVSADSVQVYKGLNIGSDKVFAQLPWWQVFLSSWLTGCPLQITVLERRGVPHHLLDILSADAEFSAGHFYDLARAAIQDIVQVGPSHELPVYQQSC